MTAGRKLLWVDATAGASGDMILGALVGLGVPLEHIERVLHRLPLSGWSLSARVVERAGLAASKVDVLVQSPYSEGKPGHHGEHRSWTDIRAILEAGSLPERVRSRSLAIFRRLVEAEAEVHGVSPAAVHLHEVGAVDAIVDVVGACAGLEWLGADRMVVSPLTTGHGTVVCAHGHYPVPAPATALLVRGVPVRAGEGEGERLTPTGAAILTTLADAWGPMPAMRPGAVGYGAGDRDFPDGPNTLRMIVGDALDWGVAPGAAHAGPPEALVLEVNVDDAPPQVVAYACERLFESGALEVYTTTVHMKKGRVGHEITVLARPEDLDALARVILSETTTLGLRYRYDRRIELERVRTAVRTSYGEVRIKVGLLEGRPVQAWPEYDDCAALARAGRVPVKEVQAAALQAWRDAEGRVGSGPEEGP